MKRLLALTALFAVAFAPAAWADHHEEQDGCDHGATSVPCRPDPSPNGKDCDAHGQHGGVNEDHCTDTEETTTSTLPSTTTTTLAPATTTTTSAQSSTSTSTVTTGTPDASSSTTTLSTTSSLPSTERRAIPPAGTLPRTGGGHLVQLIAGAIVLICTGLLLRRRG